MEFSALSISIKATLLATVITFFIGLYAARIMRHVKGVLMVILDTLFTLPLVLPPTVAGFLLLTSLGKRSFLGSLLMNVGIQVVFSFKATVIAASFVAFPIMYRTARGALEQLDENIVFAARTLGMPERKIFWKISFPLALPGVAAGTVLSFTRAFGEFGATLMLAGNIPGRTQTIPMAIYTAVAAGNMAEAYKWVIIILAISFGAIALMGRGFAFKNR